MHPVLWYRHVARPRIYRWAARRVPKPLAYWVLIRVAGECEAHWTIADVLEIYSGWFEK